MQITMNIRHAKPSDLDSLTDIESSSYPPAEGASRESIRARIEAFPDCFWIGEVADASGNLQICAFINGMCTDAPDLADDMYGAPGLHNPNGRWQMIFSVVTHPHYRRCGYASQLLERVIDDCRDRDKDGVVLTCKEALIAFYERWGFVDEGASPSTHGGVQWHQMRLEW